MSIVEVDDIDPSIVYSGAWQHAITSTRQWGGGTIHTTTETGASATISFRGTRIVVYCSLPIGIASEIVNVNLDGQVTSGITQAASTVKATYNDAWFDSGILTDAVHTLIVSNGGSASEEPFELDRFYVVGFPLTPSASSSSPVPSLTSSTLAPAVTNPAIPSTVPDTVLNNVPISVLNPSLPPNLPLSSADTTSTLISSSIHTIYSISSSSISGGTTMTTLQYATSTGADGSVVTYVINSSASTAGSHLSSPHIVAIIGGGVGGLIFALLSLFLLLFCLRRRRNKWQHVVLPDDTEGQLILKVPAGQQARNITEITPFPLDALRAPAHPSSIPGDRTFAYELGFTSPSVRYISGASPTSSYIGRSSTEKTSTTSPSSPYAPTGPSTLIVQVGPGSYSPIGSNLSSTTFNSMYTSGTPAAQDTSDTLPTYQMATTPISPSRSFLDHRASHSR